MTIHSSSQQITILIHLLAYINNTIIYTPISNFSNICYILINYFNFKITHINHINENININKYISNLSINDFSYIYKLNDLFTKKLNNEIYQCTNLFNFPDNFT